MTRSWVDPLSLSDLNADIYIAPPVPLELHESHFRCNKTTGGNPTKKASRSLFYLFFFCLFALNCPYGT